MCLSQTPSVPDHSETTALFTLVLIGLKDITFNTWKQITHGIIFYNETYYLKIITDYLVKPDLTFDTSQSKKDLDQEQLACMDSNL